MFAVETWGIAIGLMLALSVFAFKTAVGEYYYVTVAASRGRRTIFLVTLQLLYLGLFAAAFWLLTRFDGFGWATDARGFLQAGTAIHLVLCGGLFLWGVRLLSHREERALGQLNAGGWLLLALPCPVCAAAILLICAFARVLFPESARWLYIAVPLFFLLANLGFLGALWGIGRMFALQPLRLTGRLMLLIALYFTLILLIAPQFQNLESLYAAAATRGYSLPGWPLLAVGATVTLSAAAGFTLELRKRKGR